MISSAYPDASFLVALYRTEPNTVAASELAGAFRLLVTPLTAFETANALRLRVFWKQRPLPDTERSLRALRTDTSGSFGAFESVALPTETWGIAERLSESHTITLGTRGIDILHVAAAVALQVDTFLTFDQRQSRLAAAAGLDVQGVSLSD